MVGVAFLSCNSTKSYSVFFFYRNSLIHPLFYLSLFYRSSYSCSSTRGARHGQYTYHSSLSYTIFWCQTNLAMAAKRQTRTPWCWFWAWQGKNAQYSLMPALNNFMIRYTIFYLTYSHLIYSRQNWCNRRSRAKEKLWKKHMKKPLIIDVKLLVRIVIALMAH